MPGPTEAGWSWIVRILPTSKKPIFTRRLHQIQPYLASIPVRLLGRSRHIGKMHRLRHCSCAYLPSLICPACHGNANTLDSISIDVVGATSGAPEYASVTSVSGKVAPTNYKPIVGTHLVDGVPIENGAMLLTAAKGSTISSFADGMWTTFLVAETKECGYASWYDGTLNWLVTNDPNAAIAPGTGSGTAAVAPWTNATVSINVGPTPANPARFYLPSNLTSNAPINSVNWGPSSDHYMNGVVMHVALCRRRSRAQAISGVVQTHKPILELDNLAQEQKKSTTPRSSRGAFRGF